MRLTKLEMYGFKSFARKTEIQFEDGITAVIGPNGSGKSNIADAVRWVLGEQSARALRGSKMEDIIFNGTEARKALSYCEVSLTFDNSSGELHTEFAEVCVTRRMYRSGESEFFINRKGCRRKDITELFRDTGVGREGYSIIGQGRVEEILSSKSADRRNAFEEAAGVMKYRVRKEEAERKLENTRTNLVRINDILDELGRQVGPLEEQSAAAKQYLQLRDELREIEINVFLYQYDKLNERIEGLNASMKQLTDEIERGTVLDSKLAAGCDAIEERERSLNDLISRLQTELLAMTTDAEADAGESKVLHERMTNMIREKDEAQLRLDENTKALAGMGKLIQNADTAVLNGKNTLDKCSAELEKANLRLSSLTAEVDEKAEELERRKNEMIANINRLADAKVLISRFDAMKDSMEGRISEISENRKELDKKYRRMLEECVQVSDYTEKANGRRSAAKAALNAAVNSLNETNLKLKKAQEATEAAGRQWERDMARLKVLREMKSAHEGYYSSVRNLLRDAERDTGLKRRIEGVVAELIVVPDRYENAVEMSLGAALQNIVTMSEEDAKFVIDYLRKKEYGRATFLPMSAMKPRLLTDAERSLCRVRGFIGIASELVKFDEKYRNVIENLLGRTVIVEDLDAGIAINRSAKAGFRIATIKGDIINPGGSMTGGSVQKKEFSLVGREREINELMQQNALLENWRTQLADEVIQLEKALGEANAAVSEATQAFHEADVEAATQNEKLDIVKEYLRQAENAVKEADDEIERIHDDIDEINGRFENARKDQAELEQGNKNERAEVLAVQELLVGLRRTLAGMTEEVADLRVAETAAEKEYASAVNEKKRLVSESERLKAAADEAMLAIENFRARFDELSGKMDAVEGLIASKRRDVDALTDRIHSVEDERAKLLVNLDESRAKRERAMDDLMALKDRKHHCEININRAELELKSVQDRMWEDYELTYENALPLRRQIAITASHIRVDELKKAIKELGDINVNSIEEYRNVKERFDSLSVQYNDLVTAETDLHTLIDELVATMENEFRRQFAMIQTNFAETFAELFGGGKAELVLSDKNDILNCNIDIIAQPPGKKLQLLSLLSGGERALTAIALLFAILKLKPTAFCILDEIESSLDEVNVSTVANYVKNYSNNTQFILITHRKGSMEVCNALYGVAMEEKGISKVVSAKFNA